MNAIDTTSDSPYCKAMDILSFAARGVVALAVLALLHGLFFYFFFKLQPAPDYASTHQQKDKETGVQSPRGDSQKNEYSKLQKLVKQALEEDDPSLAVLPNVSRGFSLVLNHTPETPFDIRQQYAGNLSVPASPFKAHDDNVLQSTPPELVSAETLAALSDTGILLTTMEMPRPQLEMPPLPQEIWWQASTGKTIRPLLTRDNQEVDEQLVGNNPPTHMTRIEIIPMPQLAIHRVLLRTSSGNNTLDCLAIQAIRNQLRRHPNAPLLDNCPQNTSLFIFIDWGNTALSDKASLAEKEILEKLRSKSGASSEL